MTNPINIELASYASWTAFEQLDYRGWILRFADGATKRANSVGVAEQRDEKLSQRRKDAKLQRIIYPLIKQRQIVRLG